MADIKLLLDYETQLSHLKKEINELLEKETLDSYKVYQLSVEIDEVISNYYKYFYQCILD